MKKMKQIFKSKPIFRKIKTENDILKYTAKMKTNSPSEHNSNHFIVQVISLHDCFGSQKKRTKVIKFLTKTDITLINLRLLRLPLFSTIHKKIRHCPIFRSTFR